LTRVPKGIEVVGRDSLNEFIASHLSTPSTNKTQAFLTAEQKKQIQTWLRPPMHFLEQLSSLELNNQQRRFAKPASRKHQRVRGVAGSGKSLVLAQRAANLAEAGKRVLMVSFNITLWHYLRDLVSRTSNRFQRKRI